MLVFWVHESYISVSGELEDVPSCGHLFSSSRSRAIYCDVYPAPRIVGGSTLEHFRRKSAPHGNLGYLEGMRRVKGHINVFESLPTLYREPYHYRPGIMEGSYRVSSQTSPRHSE